MSINPKSTQKKSGIECKTVKLKMIDSPYLRYCCERTEMVSLEIRKVVPFQNAVNASRGKSNLYNIQ